MRKPFYKNVIVVCKKTARKNTKHSRNETILKIGDLAKVKAHAHAAYTLCKMVSLGQKLKMPKTCEKPFYKNITVVLRKKPLGIRANIREKRRV